MSSSSSSSSSLPEESSEESAFRHHDDEEEKTAAGVVVTASSSTSPTTTTTTTTDATDATGIENSRDGTGAAGVVVVAAASSSNSSSNSSKRMQHASKLCGEGRLAWQNDDYTTALQKFSTALRLLQTSLGSHHPLVAKTHYWIGFIYKHLPRFRGGGSGSGNGGGRSGPINSAIDSAAAAAAGTGSNGSSSDDNDQHQRQQHQHHQLVLKFMLLSLQEFTNSARIRLQHVSSSSATASAGAGAGSAAAAATTSSSSNTLNSKDKESLQAIEWVLKAIQDHTEGRTSTTYHDGGGSSKNKSNFNDNPYAVVSTCLDEILPKEEEEEEEQQHQQGGEDYQKPSTAWTNMRSLQRLILARPMTPSSGSTSTNTTTTGVDQHQQEQDDDDSSLFLYPYVASLKKSVEFEAQADVALRNGDYEDALKAYIESQTVFPQYPYGGSSGGSVWGKRAFCHHQLSLVGSHSCSPSSSSSSSDRQNKQHLQLALHGYRRALKCFYSSSTIVVGESNNSNSTHVGGVRDTDVGNKAYNDDDEPAVLHLEDHPDIRTTMERWEQVYKQYKSFTDDQNDNNDHVDCQPNDRQDAAVGGISTEQIRLSVEQEQDADEAMWSLLWYHQLDHGRPTFHEKYDISSTHVDATITLKRLLRPSLLNRAMDNYEGSLNLEKKFRSTSARNTMKIGDDEIISRTVFFNERVIADLEQSLGHIRSILSKIEAVDSRSSKTKVTDYVKTPQGKKRDRIRTDDSDDFATKFEDLAEANAGLEAALQSQTEQASIHSKELHEWKSRYKNLENELSMLKQQLVTTQQGEGKEPNEHKRSDSSVDSGSSSPQKIEGMHKQVRAEKDRLAARLRRKHQTPTIQSDSSNQAKTHLATIDALQSQISELKNEIEKLQLDRRDLQATITTLNDVKKQSDAMVHSLQNEVTTLQNQNEAEIMQLSTKVKKSIQRVHELEIANFKLQEQIAAKDKLLNEHQEQIEKQREKVHAVAKQQLDKEKLTNHQNERAAKIIHELSAELQNLSEARDQQEQRLARMTDLVLAMESKNRMVNQQKKLTRTPYRTTEKVKRLTAKILELQEEAGIDQEQLQGGKSRDSRDTVRRDLFGANTNSGIVQHPAPPVMCDPLSWKLALYIFLKKIISAGKSHKTTFETDTAIYSIRTNGDKDGPIFYDAVRKGCLKAADQYSDCFRPTIPSSIDVVARLRHDDSILVLSGDLNVSYINSDGCVLIDNVKNNEDVDGLLGWVDDRISLDQIFEESCYLREEYSKTQAVASIPHQFPPKLRFFTAITAFLVALLGSLLVLLRAS